MSDRPTVRLLSCTAYPLETLYIAAVSLDDPEVKFQKPEEIRMLLYTELSQHLKAEHKQFILDKMRELVNSDDPLTETVQFLFFIEGAKWELVKALNRYEEEFHRAFEGSDRLIWRTTVGQLRDTFINGIPIIKQLVVDACAALLEIDPYLYQLLTEQS